MKNIRVIIAGSRNFKDNSFLEEKLDYLLGNYQPEQVTIISGGARGADSLGEKYAHKKGYSSKIVEAEWDNLEVKKTWVRVKKDGTKYNALAGFQRNQAMADMATHAVMFWDGMSRGTQDMIERSNAKKLVVKVFRYQTGERHTRQPKTAKKNGNQVVYTY